MLILLLPAELFAGPPPSPGSSRPSLRDSQLTLQARQVLTQDELLAPLNLGVSVRQGVATVWGPVPSEAAARRAVERLRQVQGLLDIRSQMYIRPADDPTAEPPLSREPLRPPLLPLEPRSAGALMGRPGEAGVAPGQTLKAPRGAGRDWRAAGVSRPGYPRGLAEAVALLPPVPASTDRAPPETFSSLPLLIEQLRQTDPRYQQIHPQVQGGAVHLYGTVARWEDMLDFAEAVSRLPRVERVIIQRVQTDSRLAPGGGVLSREEPSP